MSFGASRTLAGVESLEDGRTREKRICREKAAQSMDLHSARERASYFGEGESDNKV